MLLNQEYFSAKKILCAGVQGTGKTVLARYISKFFTCAVYTPHDGEWINDDVMLLKPSDFIKEFPFICTVVKKMAMANKINCFVIDECDLLIKNFFDISPEFMDLIINHRHFGDGLAIIAVTRRPQDLTEKVYGCFEILCLFTIEAPNVVRLLNNYAEGLGEVVKALPYNSHKFILKHIGEAGVVAHV